MVLQSYEEKKKGDLFSSLDHSFKSNIKLGDDNSLEVTAKGVMEVNTREGKKHVHNIYYIQNLKNNLLSVGKLLKNSYKLVLKIRNV